MSPAKDDQLNFIQLAGEFKQALFKAFAKESKLRQERNRLERKLAVVSEKLSQKTDVRDIFEDKKYSSLTKATKEAFLEAAEREAPKRKKRKAKAARMTLEEKLRTLREAVAGRSEIKLAELKELIHVSNVNQWLSGLNLPSGAVESLGSKKAGSRLLVSKIKHLLQEA